MSSLIQTIALQDAASQPRRAANDRPADGAHWSPRQTLIFILISSIASWLVVAAAVWGLVTAFS